MLCYRVHQHMKHSSALSVCCPNFLHITEQPPSQTYSGSIICYFSPLRFLMLPNIDPDVRGGLIKPMCLFSAEMFRERVRRMTGEYIVVERCGAYCFTKERGIIASVSDTTVCFSLFNTDRWQVNAKPGVPAFRTDTGVRVFLVKVYSSQARSGATTVCVQETAGTSRGPLQYWGKLRLRRSCLRLELGRETNKARNLCCEPNMGFGWFCV